MAENTSPHQFALADRLPTKGWDVRGARFVRRIVLLGSAILLVTILQLLPDRTFRRAMDAQQMVAQALRVVHASEQVLSTMEDAETSVQGYLLTGDNRYLQRFQSALSNQRLARQRLRQLATGSSGQQTRIAKLDRLLEIRLSGLSGIVALYRTEGPDAAAAAVGIGEGSRAMGEILDLVHDAQQEEYWLLSLGTRTVEAQATHMRWILRMGGALLIVLITVVGVVGERDIRSQQRIEESLKDSEGRFRTLANGIPQLCWMANADGEIFWYNQRWYEFTGTKAEEMEGRGWQSVHDPGMLPVVLAGWKISIAKGEPWEMVFPLRAADGTFHPFLTRVMPMRDQSGKVVRWFGTNTDITAQRVTEDALRENQERLLLAQQVVETANKELAAFAYSVSHDLRAPLRGIDGWSLALLEDYGARLDDRARQYLNRVRSETQRMGSLIDDMLQLSRVTRDEMKRDRVDLTALANSIIAKLRDALPERFMEFVIERELVAVGDSRLLEIALTNLFSNAVKFTGPRKKALIEFGRLEKDGEMAFYLRDNGVGFDMSHAGTLFGAFQRLHKASEFPGTGIGLATVQRVVRRHGGRVWAEARVNCGATFCFTLGASA